ncbi:MAG: prolyl oligopeptidase family serine peptidase [Deltaproteobacteria bacterium]|nr:prolyl oligopeptidase family serine peptidase [Deltaproteobacteria bacterium]
MDWIQDYRAAIDYIEGKPQVDAKRIGAWGTSYGGGVVIWSTAHDDRIAVAVSQVGAMIVANGGMKTMSERKATAVAREGLGAISNDKIEKLKGKPNYPKMLQFDPVAAGRQIKVPTLFIDAENEQLFDPRDAGGRVFDIIRGPRFATR